MKKVFFVTLLLSLRIFVSAQLPTPINCQGTNHTDTVRMNWSCNGGTAPTPGYVWTALDATGVGYWQNPSVVIADSSHWIQGNGSLIMQNPALNVGIGTTTPTAYLHVYDGGSTYPPFEIQHFGERQFLTYATNYSSSQGDIDFDNDGIRFDISDQAHQFSWAWWTDTAMVLIGGNGQPKYVGIGTTTPTSLLQVAGSFLDTTNLTNGAVCTIQNSGNTFGYGLPAVGIQYGSNFTTFILLGNLTRAGKQDSSIIISAGDGIYMHSYGHGTPASSEVPFDLYAQNGRLRLRGDTLQIGDGEPGDGLNDNFALPIGTGTAGQVLTTDGVYFSTWQNPIHNAPTGSYPSSPYVGQIIIDTTLNKWFGWNGTAWKEFTTAP